MAKKKRSTSKKNKPISTIGKVLLGLLIAGVIAVASIGWFKPNLLRKIEHRIERYLNPDPKKSEIKLPNNEVIGIDVSAWQENIDWKQVQFRLDDKKRLTKDPSSTPRNIDFVIAKATEGITITDAKYTRNKKGAKENNIPFGAYHFFSVSSDAKEQADYFIKNANLQKGDLIPILDVENKGKLTPKELQTRVLIWLRAVEKFYGRKPIIYTYAKFYEEIFMEKEFYDYHFWLAHYGVANPQNECTFWQFTEEGVVYGIKGYVDINVFFGKKIEFEKYKL